MLQLWLPNLNDQTDWFFKKSVEVNDCLNNIEEVFKVVRINLKYLLTSLGNFDGRLTFLIILIDVTESLLNGLSKLVFHDVHRTINRLHNVPINLTANFLKLREHNVSKLCNLFLLFIVNMSKQFIDISVQIIRIYDSLLFFSFIFSIFVVTFVFWFKRFIFLVTSTSISRMILHKIWLHWGPFCLLVSFTS